MYCEGHSDPKSRSATSKSGKSASTGTKAKAVPKVCQQPGCTNICPTSRHLNCNLSTCTAATKESASKKAASKSSNTTKTCAAEECFNPVPTPRHIYCNMDSCTRANTAVKKNIGRSDSNKTKTTTSSSGTKKADGGAKGGTTVKICATPGCDKPCPSNRCTYCCAECRPGKAPTESSKVRHNCLTQCNGICDNGELCHNNKTPGSIYCATHVRNPPPYTLKRT